jgi:hypothetical protein
LISAERNEFGEMAPALDDVAAAESLYDLMQPWDGLLIGMVSMAYDGPAARLLGQLATVLAPDPARARPRRRPRPQLPQHRTPCL